jgi:tetratricopeptide (TPR) repeat protein
MAQIVALNGVPFALKHFGIALSASRNTSTFEPLTDAAAITAPEPSASGYDRLVQTLPLLSARAKRVLKACSVFENPIPTIALGEVSSLNTDEQRAATEELLSHGLVDLTDYSLSSGHGYISLPAWLKKFIGQSKQNQSEIAELATRHAKYFLNIAITADETLQRSAGSVLREVARDLENLHAALSQLERTGCSEDALRIFVLIVRWHFRSARFEEIRDEVNTTIARSSLRPASAEIAALFQMRAAAEVRKGNLQLADNDYESAIKLWMDVKRIDRAINAMCTQADVASSIGEIEKAGRIIAKATALSGQLTDPYQIGYVNLVAGRFRLIHGNTRDAIEFFRIAYKHTVNRSNTIHALVCVHLAECKQMTQLDRPVFRELIDEAIRTADSSGVHGYQHLAREHAARQFLEHGDVSTAKRLATEAEERAMQTDYDSALRWMHILQIDISICEGDVAIALNRCRHYIEIDDNDKFDADFFFHVYALVQMWISPANGIDEDSARRCAQRWKAAELRGKLLYADVIHSIGRTLLGEQAVASGTQLVADLRQELCQPRRRQDTLLLNAIDITQCARRADIQANNQMRALIKEINFLLQNPDTFVAYPKITQFTA